MSSELFLLILHSAGAEAFAGIIWGICVGVKSLCRRILRKGGKFFWTGVSPN